MRAKKQAKIFARQRVALESVIPSATPFSVEIDVCSACNFSCAFCFQADKAKYASQGCLSVAWTSACSGRSSTTFAASPTP